MSQSSIAILCSSVLAKVAMECALYGGIRCQKIEQKTLRCMELHSEKQKF